MNELELNASFTEMVLTVAYLSPNEMLYFHLQNTDRKVFLLSEPKNQRGEE